MKTVSKETAILLKEKGYDVPVRQMYKNHKQEPQKCALVNVNTHEGLFSAPTLFEASEWLRGTKDIYSLPTPAFESELWGYQFFIKNKTTNCWDLSLYKNTGYISFDKSLEESIIYALVNLVK